MAGRLLLIAVAVICATVGALALRSDHLCTQTVERAKHLRPGSPQAERRDLSRDTLRRCAAATQPIIVAAAFRATGHEADAVEITRALTVRRPEDYVGWYALGRLTSDPTTARRALQRAHSLNPRAVAAPS